MRRLLPWLLSCLLLVGCGRVSQPPTVEEDPVCTVCTSFMPLYALAEPILRDVPDTRLVCLTQPQNGCLRDYALSEWDLQTLAKADMLLLGGRGLESFDTFIQSGQVPAATLLDGFPLITGGASEADESHFSGENPWAFLSPEGAGWIVHSVCACMQLLDPENAQTYTDNLLSALVHIGEAEEAIALALPADSPRPVVALLHEGLPYIAKDLGFTETILVLREPGTELSDNELADALETFRSANCTTAWLERQAPPSLVRALEAAGISVYRMDTCTDLPQDNAFEAYLAALMQNAQTAAKCAQ